jgi:hypothetical protein
VQKVQDSPGESTGRDIEALINSFGASTASPTKPLPIARDFDRNALNAPSASPIEAELLIFAGTPSSLVLKKST